MNEAIAIQAQKIRLAYAVTRSPNPEYEREFDILSDMRADAQAAQFRRDRGLPHNAKTPYDR
jgi:hypothetical protein